MELLCYYPQDENRTRRSSILNKSTSNPTPSNAESSYPNLEFHLRDALGSEHELNLPLFALESGKFKIDYHELQALVHTLNESNANQGYKSGELNGLGLLSLISHKLIRLYRNQVNHNYIKDLTAFLSKKFGPIVFEQVLTNYLTALPTQAFKSSNQEIEEYLKDQHNTVPNTEILVEELLVHILALNNPAFEKYKLVFKEEFHPEVKTPDTLLNAIQTWSDASAGFGSSKRNIIELLSEPMLAAPNSIEDQLEYIRSKWGNFLGSHLLDLLRGLDQLEEENRFRGAGPGESQVPSYSGDLLDGEFYSDDSEWMPRVVMIARNTLVWMDQLSKKYQREIKKLHDIPDEELDLLAQQGFTVLWLIGLWSRSDISKKIKHWCGNPDAESSAYSLKEYRIDESIGGPDALANLKHRAWERGIRLASDMVPNHTGLDSTWLKEHPDWYVSTDDPPFPAYKFEGGNLSNDPEISIQLEDHYYDRSDAAVVFKQHDQRNGKTSYVYHGNDGTSMPWNDTAQLNYLNPELRETIIQTILDVARQFKVIRFDAAMTLAKRHIQRLWFPEPGSGGDIPSRSNFSMSGADFNAAIPAEFWREVVDRVAREVPDTLLLAEAFWMMESYFVRTLGMHRVYNSAFMNMLKMEENTKFFDMIAKTLEFDPRILQRFVNFLSNPDEDTAIAQFGKGDKYFGATVLMVTLPGLPMFAHAQVEGFEEKYGMEYSRAYWDETPDQDLIARHKHLIFPLMKKRYLFAGAGDFRLFPMTNIDGHRADSVFAYTNRSGTERALVLVNNAYESQAGWIKTSVPVNTQPTADDPNLESQDLVFALAFDVEDTYYIIFQEQNSKLWFIRSIEEIRNQGLYLELSGYESQVYLNFQLVSDTEIYPWTPIYKQLGGSGIVDFEPMFRAIELEPIHQLFTNFIGFIGDARVLPPKSELFVKFAPLLESILEMENISLDFEDIQEMADNFDAELRLAEAQYKSLHRMEADKELLQVTAIIILARLIKSANPEQRISLIKSCEFQKCIDSLFTSHRVEDLPGLIGVLEFADGIRPEPGQTAREFISKFFTELLAHEEVQHYFMISDADTLHRFNPERMESFLKYFERLFLAEKSDTTMQMIVDAVRNSGLQIVKFLENLS